MEAQVGKVRKTKAEERGDLANHAARNIEEPTYCLRELWDSLEELRINMEEHFSETHRFQAIEAAVETLEEVIDNLERAVAALDEIDFNW